MEYLKHQRLIQKLHTTPRPIIILTVFLFFLENCTYQECRIGSAFVPDLQGQFLATENFFFTSKVRALNTEFGVWSFL
jgi:hypothetical protein